MTGAPGTSPPDTGEPPVEPETESSTRFAWRVLRADPGAWLVALGLWVAFFSLPLPVGLALRSVLDRLATAETGDLAGALAVLAGLQIGRWILLLPAIVQWHGAYVFWQTLPRVNVLRSLVGDPGPVTGRLPGSPGEAVSRFRDDTRDIANVLDVWLDLGAAGITSVAGLAILWAIEPRSALAMVVPILVVLWTGHLLATRLRRWRWAEREATATVTGFIGDVFGSIATVKTTVAEEAVLRRFEAIGHERATAARRDQVGTQLSQTLGGITSNAGLGLALLAVVPAVRRGDLSVGDIGLFTTYATAVGGLPRITARWATFQRQGDVAAARLARLAHQHEADRASAPAPTWLRHGPPAFVPASVTPPRARRGRDRLDTYEVRGLGVRLEDGAGSSSAGQLQGVDLTIRRGQFVVVTGPVGSGKSVLLRALLGLVPRSSGTVAWNGEDVADPSMLLVPPRAAYVPQVPRLFSEPLEESVLLGHEPSGLNRVLRLTCLDDDLADMPDGVRTTVGAKGVRLSGGQVQRVATARALIRRPELLVIDDLSSALDVATEARLWDGLFAATDGNLTVLATSHRPRVLDRADVVITLHDGWRTG
jgi:ATP-binding cassette subfamily B protein